MPPIRTVIRQSKYYWAKVLRSSGGDKVLALSTLRIIAAFMLGGLLDPSCELIQFLNQLINIGFECRQVARLRLFHLRALFDVRHGGAMVYRRGYDSIFNANRIGRAIHREPNSLPDVSTR